MAFTVAYNMQVQTRYLFPGGRRDQWFEMRRAIFHCYFTDTDGLTATLTSDGSRLVGSCPWSQQRQSGLAADNTVRSNITIRPKTALAGHFFDTLWDKVIPSSGVVEYYGVQLETEQIRREPEFSDETDDLTGATTYVVEADAGGGEVDAHA